MIHAIYLKSKPKNKWQLHSIVNSAEIANDDLIKALKNAKLSGLDQVEGAIQIFESSFYIPESLKEIKNQKLLFN